MNSSVTPLIPPGSSLSGSSPSSTSSSSKCAKQTAGFFKSGWLPFSFLKRKKLVVLGLGGHEQFGFWNFRATVLNLPSQPPWWPLGNLNMFSPVDLPSGRLPSLSIAWEVHCRSNPSSAPPHNLGENSQGRKLLVLINALRGKCPSPTKFPCQPSIIEIVFDSACQVLSHCYNVHPRSSTHHPRLCQYQSSILTLQDTPARILWHRARGCNPCILHIGTWLNPTSNFGKSLHLWGPHP